MSERLTDEEWREIWRKERLREDKMLDFHDQVGDRMTKKALAAKFNLKPTRVSLLVRRHDEARERQRMLAEIEQLKAALQALVDKLDEIHADPRYKSVWTSYMIHGGQYHGPTYVDELARARAALKDALQATTPP